MSLEPRLIRDGPLGRPERKQLYYHRVIADRLCANPQWIGRAKERLVSMRKTNPCGAFFHNQWDTILEQPIERVAEQLREPTLRMADLRQETPFLGLIDKTERLAILKRFSAEEAYRDTGAV